MATENEDELVDYDEEEVRSFWSSKADVFSNCHFVLFQDDFLWIHRITTFDPVQ